VVDGAVEAPVEAGGGGTQPAQTKLVVMNARRAQATNLEDVFNSYPLSKRVSREIVANLVNSGLMVSRR
jgi:hypothetical protein